MTKLHTSSICLKNWDFVQDRILKMKSKLRNGIVIVLYSMILFILSVSICKAEEFEDIDYVEEVIKTTDIEIDGYKEELMLGETMNLAATVVPSNATDTVVTYKSSDVDIAMVKSSGMVEGKKAGKVIIYASCGDIVKELPITVKVKTKNIEVKSKYVVLHQGETFEIEAKVVPDTADKEITYKSLDENVAQVSDKGSVSAKGYGSTSIVVSNGYCEVSITIVVNSNIVENKMPIENVSSSINAENLPEVIDVNTYKIVTEDMLRHYYEKKKNFTVIGEKYKIYIDASDIVNCDNELNTQVDFIETPDGIAFEIKNKLCGKIVIDIERLVTNEKYLYIYNGEKEQYQRLYVEDIKTITIDTTGKYLISDDDLTDGAIKIVYIIGGLCILIIGIVIYIIVKNKYWFW